MSLGKFILAFTGCLVFAHTLCQSYHLFSYASQLPIWASAGIIHSLLAAITLLFYKQTPRETTATWKILLPGTAILLVQAALVLFSLASSDFSLSGPSLENIDLKYYAWITWIPIVEELTFRVGIGNFLKKKCGTVWGSYFSILIFCAAHSVALWNQPADLLLKVPVGVMLLAISCEFIYGYTRSKLSIIWFHSACNLSGLIFLFLDKRWLDWLNFLYH